MQKQNLKFTKNSKNIAQDLYFLQNGEILPNLVTLTRTDKNDLKFSSNQKWKRRFDDDWKFWNRWIKKLKKVSCVGSQSICCF